MWGGGWIKLCGKHGKIGGGQYGEVVNCTFVENMFLLVVPVGRWPVTTLLKTWYNTMSRSMWEGGKM